MSYVSLGEICQNKNGAAFSNGTKPLPTVLLSNWGGASYASAHNQLDSRTASLSNGTVRFKNAYSKQMDPYGCSMCTQK